MSRTPTTVRVLHVDDDPDLGELVAVSLEREDDRFDVLTATGPDPAMDVLDSEPVDCVVSDYDMPGETGIEFLERVRESYPDLPFILYTGKGSEAVASDAISAGVTDYLQKGVGTDQYTLLANRIDNAVSAARSRNALEERNRRLETLISNLPGIVYRCRNEPGWPMEFVAGECADITGYTADDLESGRVVWGEDILYPDDRERMWEAVQAALDADEPFEVTYRTTTADDEVRWMWERGRAIGAEQTHVDGFITDVTERRERERALERYRTMVDTMPNFACLYDAEGRFEVVNDHFAEFYRTTPEALEGEQSTLVEQIRAQADGDDPFRAVVDGEREELRGEVDVEFPNHGHSVVAYRLARLQIDGQFDGVVCVARDVTGWQDHEHQLTETSARLEAFVETSPDMVDVLDPEGRIVDANQRLCETLGYTEDELLGTPIWEVDERFEAEDVARDLADMSVDEARKFDGEYRRADGSTFPVEVHLVRVGLRGRDRYLAISRDITERKRREDALNALTEATRRFIDARDRETVAEHAVETAATVLDHDLAGVWCPDEDDTALRPVAVTDEARSLLGEPPTYTGGESLSWEAFRTGEVTVCEDLQSEPDRYNPETPIESEIILPLGEYGIVVVGATEPADFDEVGVWLARILANTVEAALDRAAREQESLEHRRRLERQNERLDEFAGIVSHDLRNPLQVATARVGLLQEEMDSEHLDAIDRSHDRMATLIDDLLALGREGETVLDIEPVDLESVARACWDTVGEPDASLVVETDATVRADRRRLQQLLENLVGNSVEHGSTRPVSQARQDTDGTRSADPAVADAPDDAVEDGSTTSRPQADESVQGNPSDPAVTVTVGTLADESGFYVADDGPGIPEAQRDDVFSSGFSTSEDGTGFGLSIVEHVADAHGWSVHVTDHESGDGTDERDGSGTRETDRSPGARFEITGIDVTD